MRTDFAEPERVEDLVDGARLDLAGLTFTVAHTPGHTPGSVMFDVSRARRGARLVLTGDTAVRRVDRADRPPGRRPGGDDSGA